MSQRVFAWARTAGWPLLILALLVGAPFSSAHGFTLQVAAPDGTPVGGFRWLVEENNAADVTPGEAVPGGPDGPLSVNIHNSHATVLASGHADGSSVVIDLPAGQRYMVSVLPDADYTISGANVAAGQQTVNVTVNALPLPTAQLSILAFEDHFPINNEPNVPGIGPGGQEVGLEGFSILLHDNAGQVSQDAFGNPLGTTYQQDPEGNFILDGDGNPMVAQIGTGEILTDADGLVLIKYLPPGKYGIQIVPPLGSDWIQVSTIEGTPTVDAWLKANEPNILVEFGPVFNHVFIGFVSPSALPWALNPPAPVIAGTITGQVVNNHISRPPQIRGFPGAPVPECWVGLNDIGATQAGLIAVPCDADGNFTIAGIPPGLYQLVFWDRPLDYIFNFTSVTIPPEGGTVDLGQVPMFAWFGKQQGYVFFDANENGFREAGEAGIRDQNLNLRFRDGSIYQATPTDPNGYYEFPEVFPFFKWLVSEVDFARFKATGATIAVDEGGEIPAGFNPASPWTLPTFDKLTPQTQAEVNTNTGNSLSRTEVEDGLTAPVLLEGVMTFAGMTNVIDWGKTNYAEGENGGITGIVHYAVTIAEDDPRYAAAEDWEPGIPRVQINLYRDHNADGVIDDLNLDGLPTLADVDNHPQGNFPGAEDVDRNGNGQFDPGDALNIVYADSWDDNKPTGCIQPPLVVHGQPVRECFDNFGTWDQVRPALFDGGFGFFSYFPGGMASGSEETPVLPSDTYIVEAPAPPGYQHVKEEDKNVDFGDTYVPSPLLLPPICVGDQHTVPAELTLFPGIPSAFGGQTRPLCDRKQQSLATGENSAVDFFLKTDVPKAARAVGVITNDLGAELDPNNPQFGEKPGPSWLPISFRDYKGRELIRTYSDEFGAYEALVPSSYSVNIPTPTGVSPQMTTVCLNDPGPIPDPANSGQNIIDPYFNPNYSHTCYTLDFWPGKTTYLDTPVVSAAAFTSNLSTTLDVSPAGGTPVIAAVTGTSGGPLVCNEAETVTITSAGLQQVPNPNHNPADPDSPAQITRDYSFGSATGTVTLNGTPLTVVSWSADTIQVLVPLSLQPGGSLIVTRGDNLIPTQASVTLHVGGCGAGVVTVTAGQSIQAAIDAAPEGALILVGPGTYYENLVIWKNIRLQGSGAGSTIIDALPVPAERVTAWKSYVQGLITNNPAIILPGQSLTNLIDVDTAPGILVLVADGAFSAAAPGLIDGFSITGSSIGGGILVNAHAHYLTISNNLIRNNLGNSGGGIRIGLPGLDGGNDHVTIRRNQVTQNAGLNGGSGISLYAGSTDYLVAENVISGNFTTLNGGGIAHLGLSDGGRIENNVITFNEVFYGGQAGGAGGGIYITGDAIGAGSVTINGNLIQGNLAGSGSGGGIRALAVNGTDLTYRVDIFNNIVVNNVAALVGGGIALKDAINVNIVNNTVSHNDSTATAALAFVGGNLNESVPLPAGIVGEVNSEALATASGEPFSSPLLSNNIVYHNRSFFRDATANGGLGALFPAPDHSSGSYTAAEFWDLGVNGTAGTLNPDSCLLTSLSGPFGEDYNDGSNVVGDPVFSAGYFNTLLTAGAADEGGNFINVYPSPLSIIGTDYHLSFGSAAVDSGAANDTGTFPTLAADFDGETRPNPASGIVDIGADELFRVTQVAAYRQGQWFLDNGNGRWDGTDIDTAYLNFGAPGDLAVAGDVDGNGVSEIGVYRPMSGQWFFDLDHSGSWSNCLGSGGTDLCLEQFGAPTDLPVTGDVDGDGTAEVGAYRPATGQWFFDLDHTGNWSGCGPDLCLDQFGAPTDLPVTGDVDGDGTAEVGVYRPATGQWFFDLDHNGTWSGCGPDLCLDQFGAPTDIPVMGDWDGDGTFEVGTYRQGIWYLDFNGNGQWDGPAVDKVYANFGAPSDRPVTGFWR